MRSSEGGADFGRLPTATNAKLHILITDEIHRIGTGVAQPDGDLSGRHSRRAGLQRPDPDDLKCERTVSVPN
jgi:hypothetical protein